MRNYLSAIFILYIGSVIAIPAHSDSEDEEHGKIVGSSSSRYEGRYNYGSSSFRHEGRYNYGSLSSRYEGKYNYGSSSSRYEGGYNNQTSHEIEEVGPTHGQAPHYHDSKHNMFDIEFQESHPRQNGDEKLESSSSQSDTYSKWKKFRQGLRNLGMKFRIWERKSVDIGYRESRGSDGRDVQNIAPGHVWGSWEVPPTQVDRHKEPKINFLPIEPSSPIATNWVQDPYTNPNAILTRPSRSMSYRKND